MITSPHRPESCLVCSSPQGASPHFGTVSCLACAAFFRRTVSLNITFTCKKDNNCPIYFELRMICRSCRYSKCLKAGMKRNSVQKRRPSKKEPRTLGEESLRKVKKEFKDTVKKEPNNSDSEEDDKHQMNGDFLPQPNSSSVESYTEDDATVVPSTSFHSNSSLATSHLSPISVGLPYAPKGFIRMSGPELLQHFVDEEKKAMDRRRLMFTVKPLTALTQATGTIPYTRDDLLPHTLRAQVENVKFDHVLGYEYCKAMPGLQYLADKEKELLMRTCALGFSVTDLGYITACLMREDENILVFTDGSYSTCGEGDFSVGWDDEELISHEDKKRLFLEFNKRFFASIIRPMRDIGLDQVEHAALKALCTWKLGYYDYTSNMRTIGREMENILLHALNHYYVERPDRITRMGNLILILGNLFEMFRIVTDMYTQMDFFNLLRLDNISRALLDI